MYSVLPVGQTSQVIYDDQIIVGVIGERQYYIGLPIHHPWIINNDLIFSKNYTVYSFVPKVISHHLMTRRNLCWIGWSYDYNNGLFSKIPILSFQKLRTELLSLCQQARIIDSFFYVIERPESFCCPLQIIKPIPKQV